jgi:GT2 family glycosyltransferase
VTTAPGAARERARADARADARPEVSVVTPTHDRRDSLLRLLRALRDGTFPADRYEVVVVADGCGDDTVAAVGREAWPFALRVLEQTPGRGAAAARNLGASHARGALLVFIDDDIEPLPTLLAAHARAQRERPGSVLIGPPLPVRGARPDFHALAAWAWWEEQFARMRRPGHRFGYEDVFSGILSVPADAFAGAGAFDVALDNCRDDSELGYRLLRAGAPIAFLPDGAGWHHELRDRARLVRRKRAEGRADVRLARRHPELLPALRLAWPEPPARTALGVVRRLALAAPRAGDAVAALLARALGPLESLRMRGAWRAANAGVMYYWYWRGVRDAVGGRAGLAELCAWCAAHAGPAPREVELDLADGLDAAERLLDEERPDGAVVRWRGVTVGRIEPRAGMEPLRGAHLRRILATTLAWPLVRAMALAGGPDDADGASVPLPSGAAEARA